VTDAPVESTEASNPDAAAVYIERHADGTEVAVYRASSLMSCQNLLLMARLGYDGSSPPEWMQKRFDAGHDHEPLILAKLESEGQVEVYNRQGSVDLPVGSKAVIRGHIDGMLAGKLWVSSINGYRFSEPTTHVVDGLVIVDAKALSKAGYAKWVANQWRDFPYYLWQQFAYAKGYGAVGVLMAVKCKDSDEHVWDYWEIDAMPITAADLYRRVLYIEGLAEHGESAIFSSPCDPVSFPCPYWMFHPTGQDVTIDDGELTGGFEALETLALKRNAAAEREREAKREKESLDEEITELVSGRVAKAKLPGGANFSTYHTTRSITDWAAIAQAVGEGDADDARERFTQTVPSQKLTVKVTVPKEKP
jgi:hypothetical protein